MTTLANVEGFFGTIWFIGLVFVAGAVIGTPLWNWVKKYFPWNQ
jgi:H+/gluconate symporter-like permease|tara:strand:- start:502 stop:633 length:132 start_codon:yes stop_codon:yes gene_type:complete